MMKRMTWAAGAEAIKIAAAAAVILSGLVAFPAEGDAQAEAPAQMSPSTAGSNGEGPPADSVGSQSTAPPAVVPSATAPSSPAPAFQTADGVAVAEQKPAQLPHNLSPWGMFLAADIVVKAVMIGLAFASLVTWTVWFAKTMELFSARRRLNRALASVQSASSLAEASHTVGSRDRVTATLIAQALTELRLSSDVLDRPGTLSRVESRLAATSEEARRAMNRGTGIIATIGATAPFVGLFGTVWGIMNSFIGISKSQTTNLAVVAPGIAEALLATAIGLVAAIPAVIIYNQFSRSIGAYKAGVGATAAEILRHASRDLDRGLKFQPMKAAAE